MGYRCTLGKIGENFVETKYDKIYHGVTMDLQKKSFIELVESCPRRY